MPTIPSFVSYFLVTQVPQTFLVSFLRKHIFSISFYAFKCIFSENRRQTFLIKIRQSRPGQAVLPINMSTAAILKDHVTHWVTYISGGKTA